MAEVRDWRSERDRYARFLEERTGASVDTWNRRIERERFEDEGKLRAWLTQREVTGYPQDFLVMERFGYPDFFLATADELIDAQYADRPNLRPICEAVVKAALAFGEVTIQARKTYVSLVSPRRTFARIQATTRDRIDLAFRLAGAKPGGRLAPSRIHETMKVQVGLSSPEDVDAQVLAWLKRSYDENR